MPLHPIAVVSQVLEEYRSYLATEFRASDEKLRRALERALDEPRFLAQEPFFQARSYNNQRHHERLSWPRIAEDLESLASNAPERLAPERGDASDPRPWLDAFDAGVGSPLELRFLELFERHDLAVEKQVPVAANDGERPISIADYMLAGSRVAIYVDGAAFHRGERLRRDRRIRERLRAGSPGWKIVELRASDLGRGEALVTELRALSERRE